MKALLLKLIRFYQHTKPFHHNLLKQLFMADDVCRFSPHCSDYTYEVIEKYGAAKGSWLGFKRIIRCHPWSKGGFDPVT
jgi:putative membrane protein insertion efficiency factor